MKLMFSVCGCFLYCFVHVAWTYNGYVIWDEDDNVVIMCKMMKKYSFSYLFGLLYYVIVLLQQQQQGLQQLLVSYIKKPVIE
jgi:hypothetical protein